jgi:hypothetical protein
VWSPAPVHEPLVPKELFEVVEERARRNEARGQIRPLDYPKCHGRRNGRFYVLRGRVRCALCGRRMEGTHQRNANWYRCRFEANRGSVAADVAGLFGPDRLRLLRDELACSVAEGWREHGTQLARLRLELEDLATRRIEDLSARRASVEEAIRDLEVRRPDEIEAMLAAVPDLRPSLKTAGPEDLADLLEAFDVTAVYNKTGRTLELGATVMPELVPDNEKPRRSRAPSGISSIAGAGFEPATFGL